MARFWTSSSGAGGISAGIAGGCLTFLLLIFAVIGILGIASLIYAST